MALNKPPEQQFQIGDKVIYLPEGVYTEITGYVWSFPDNVTAKIKKYRLSCGITARSCDLIDNLTPKSQHVRAQDLDTQSIIESLASWLKRQSDDAISSTTLILLNSIKRNASLSQIAENTARWEAAVRAGR